MKENERWTMARLEIVQLDTIDGGGGRSSGGIYELGYTLGQPDAAPVATGGSFVLQPGFWGGYAALPTNNRISRDGFEN